MWLLMVPFRVRLASSIRLYWTRHSSSATFRLQQPHTQHLADCVFEGTSGQRRILTGALSLLYWLSILTVSQQQQAVFAF